MKGVINTFPKQWSVSFLEPILGWVGKLLLRLLYAGTGRSSVLKGGDLSEVAANADLPTCSSMRAAALRLGFGFPRSEQLPEYGGALGKDRKAWDVGNYSCLRP